MKGVLKIKYLKKYMTIVLAAFAFLFLNLNSVNAQELPDYTIDYDNFLYNMPDTSGSKVLTDGSLEKSTNSSTFEFKNKYRIYGIRIYINDHYTMFSYKNDEGKFIAAKIGDLGRNQNKWFNLSIKQLYDVDYIETDSIRVHIGSSDNQYSELEAYGYELTSPYEFNINNLNYDINNNEITFNYELPTDENFSHLELHQDGLLLADNIITNYFEVYNLEYDTKYNFTFYAVDKDGNKSNGISREISLPSDPNLIPSNNIFGLTHSVSDTTVSFNYSLPLDNNFSHLKIYRNNELISDNYQLSEYIDTGLEPETEYNYRFVSVNKLDISNVGYAITIKTMEEDDTVPPAVPTGLNTTNMNSGIILSWNSNTESDLKGYNVYMNGIKMNSKPIINTVYNITNLENGTDYSFTISAVDTFDNESEQSSNVVGVPDVEQLPIFKLDTKLSSIGSSVENWFSEIWLIVAFATAIPLSFVIAGRIKGLFIA